MNCTRDSCRIEEVIVRYAKENLILANVFMSSPYVMRFMKEEKNDKMDAVAKIGGQLGLAVGFSIVSLFEILYYLVGCFTTKSSESKSSRKISRSGNK